MFLSAKLMILYNFGTKCRRISKLRQYLSEQRVRHLSCSQSRSWRILFFGNDIFSLQSLKFLKTEQEYRLITRLEVITKAASENPITDYCKANQITFHKWPFKSNEIKDFDLGVVVSFGYLIPKDIIEKFPLGMVNVHASLLPRWRGASPISHAILHGDSKTGVTIMRIEPHRFDIGAIISQKEISVEKDDTYSSLLTRLSILGASELIECIHNLPQSLENAKPQSSTGITYAPKLTKEMAELNFETTDATTIYALARAISHVYPLTTSWWGTPVKLQDVFVSNYAPPSGTSRPGRIFFSRRTRSLHVECLNRSFISFSKIALPRRTPMSGLDFYNGFLSKRPEHEWVFNLQEDKKCDVG